MYPQSYGSWAPVGLGWSAGVGGLILILLIIWSLIWKGLALWKSAREGSKVWFVVFLVVNTIGILEILYLYVFSKKRPPVMETKEPQAK
ncbi:MAG: DUF5652 family protein [Minisyncoccia bacterium]|jgi:methionyl-tRNA synthetase